MKAIEIGALSGSTIFPTANRNTSHSLVSTKIKSKQYDEQAWLPLGLAYHLPLPYTPHTARNTTFSCQGCYLLKEKEPPKLTQHISASTMQGSFQRPVFPASASSSSKSKSGAVPGGLASQVLPGADSAKRNAETIGTSDNMT